MLKSTHRSPLDLLEWIGVLAFSTKYCFKVGVKDALSILRNPPGNQVFAPCFKLRLAWQFMVEDWYQECVDDIFGFPPLEFNHNDFNDLGGEVSAAINSARVRVYRHRLELIPFIPEPAHASNCVDRGRCARDWSHAYSTAMLFFAHTRRFYTGRDVFSRLKAMEVASPLEECRKMTLTDISDRGVLWKEEQFLEEGKLVVLDLLRSTRPTSIRPKPRYVPKDDPRASPTGFYTLA